MTEESTTPDLVEHVRGFVEAASGGMIQKGRPASSSGEVELRHASVAKWEDGKIARITNCSDIDEARAAGKRLAEERR